MTRTAMRTGAKAIKQALRAKPAVSKPAAAKPTTAKVAVRKPATAKSKAKPVPAKRIAAPQVNWSKGTAIGATGARRYRLFKPSDMRRGERLPLLVMLHGCGQDAEALAVGSHMNRVATQERFLVLYPEQERLANAQRCWNWHETRSGRAQIEADSINATIDHICRTQPVDPDRIALAGLSAGAGMAALLATRHPERFRAVAMHSGIAPGVAHSSVSAISAMGGRGVAGAPLAPLAAGVHLPALLVIQGSADHFVAPSNGVEAARLWAAREGATPSAARTVQRGARYPAKVTDYRAGRRLVVTLCEVVGLGHAWSGGTAGKSYSDPKGPDASRMIWTFMAKQFAR